MAVDSVGAGIGEMVLFSRAVPRVWPPDLKDAPVDAVIIGIVDRVDVVGKTNLQRENLTTAAAQDERRILI